MRERLRAGRFVFPPFKGTYSFGTVRAALLACKLGGVATVTVASQQLFYSFGEGGLPAFLTGVALLNLGVAVFAFPRKVAMVEPGPAASPP